MKTCKTGCGKMKAGGSIKKMAKGGQALSKAKGFAKPTKGGSNVADQIYGVPNAGPTGPNRQGIDTMKKGGAAKAKFGASVNAQRGYPGKIRSANDQGYTAIGQREPGRTKFAKGGFPDLTGDGKVTKADVLKGRGVFKKGGENKNWIQDATASIKRRGTEGKCTPITKPGCTGKAKALAKTFKKIAKNR